MVVAQLVEQLLPTLKIRGSTHDIDKMLSTICTIEKTKIKEKRPGMAHLKKANACVSLFEYDKISFKNLIG